MANKSIKDTKIINNKDPKPISIGYSTKLYLDESKKFSEIRRTSDEKKIIQIFKKKT